MALWINTIFGFLFVLTSHPLHMTFTNIEYIETRQKWEVSIKLFKDDFGDELKRLYGVDIDFEKLEDDPERAVYFQRFVSDHFSLQINNAKIGIKDWKFIGEKINYEAVWLNYAFTFNDLPKSIEIRNSLMFGLFRDQKNLLIFNYKDRQKAFQFRHNKEKIAFELD